MTDKILVNLTHIDGDDWHWYYVDGELVYEGHAFAELSLMLAILKAMGAGPRLDTEFAYAFIDEELAQRAHQNASTLEKFFELGLEEGDLE